MGCLLIHGFTGSPNELLDLRDFLVSKNLTVSVPTLPGHGTYSGDLFNYTWKHWFEQVKAAYFELCEQCEEIYVCGLSMGGTLALHLAAHKPVNGVVALAAPVNFPTWKKLSVRLLKGVYKYRHKRGGEDVRDQSAKPKLGSYQRYPYIAVVQLFRLVEHVREDLSEISQPILVMHSQQDHTVDFHNAQIIMESVHSTAKRLVELRNSYHVITVDYDKTTVMEEVFKFVQMHSKSLKRKAGSSKLTSVGKQRAQ